MISFREEKRKICFNCAAIYESPNVRILKCPECGKEISSRRYDAIVKNVREAVEYGYNYRKRYEADFEKDGRITKHYALIPYEEIVVFIALAAISGIIGNISTDVVRKVITKIRGNLDEETKNKFNERIFDLIDDPDKMEEFVRYIEAYYECFEGVNQEVREAIYEEMVVDRISPTMDELINVSHPEINILQVKKKSPFTDEENFKRMLEIRKEVERIRTLKQSFFQDFWKEIED